MSNPVAGFSGLASGFQWRDIVDQLVRVEEIRTVTPITSRLDLRTSQREPWSKFASLTNTLNDAARTLRSGGIGGFLATASASSSTSRAIVAPTASSSATPGTYKVEVLQLAQAAKVSGGTTSSVTAALGHTGSFQLNGKTINIAATDSLEKVRNTINSANTGTAPTGVAATILSDGGGGGRLVLARTAAGSQQIEINDGAGGLARALGFLDSRTRPLSNTAQAIAAALGLTTSPPPASIRVGGRLITVDLATESFNTIVAKINAAGGQASSVAEDYGAETRYRMVVQDNVQAVDGDADSQAVIDALGFGAGGFGNVKQTVATRVFTDSSDNVASSDTELAGLKLNGTSTGLAVGDAINIRGTRGDGTSVSIGVTIANGDTMQTLVDRINDPTSGFAAGARGAKAILADDGSIRLMDGQGGESRLSLSLGVIHSSGAAGTLGPVKIVTAGRSRELVAGQDAQVNVDGVLLTRSSNTVTNAISGVTLNLLNAEPGTTVNLDVERNSGDGLKAVKAFADAYNSIVRFFDEQRAVDQPLAGSASLRSVVSSFTAALRVPITGNSTFSRLSLLGVELDRDGLLAVNESSVRDALLKKPDEVENLFGFDGVGGALVKATDSATQFGIGTISSQIKSIDDGNLALRNKRSEAEQRLEFKRQSLIERFTRMERALSSLNAQGSYLTQQIKSLQSN